MKQTFIFPSERHKPSSRLIKSRLMNECGASADKRRTVPSHFLRVGPRAKRRAWVSDGIGTDGRIENQPLVDDRKKFLWIDHPLSDMTGAHMGSCRGLKSELVTESA